MRNPLPGNIFYLEIKPCTGFKKKTKQMQIKQDSDINMWERQCTDSRSVLILRKK